MAADDELTDLDQIALCSRPLRSVAATPLDLPVAAVHKHDPTWGWNRLQVDRRRLGHIRLDLTSLDSGMWLESTSNDFTSSEVMRNLRE